MARIVLVTGGSRSGKSAHAQGLAEARPGRRVFVATCPVFDAELAERVRRHREARQAASWETIEEPLDLAAALRASQPAAAVVVDCLTLWINNLLFSEESLTEEAVVSRCASVIAEARSAAGTVVFVTNEVGMGIVPDNPLARRYRDLAGRCNQVMAAGADEVVFLACGIPLPLKKERERATAEP